MKFIIFFLGLSGWFALINKVTRNYSMAIVFFPAIWISIAFTANFFDLLPYTFYIFQLIGFLSFSYFTFLSWWSRQIKIIFPTEFLIFFAFCIIWFFRMGFSYYSVPDEFYNWGIVIKELYIFDGFSPQNLSGITRPEYPNGPAIFQYYFIRFFGYSEGISIFANNCLFTMFTSFLIYASGRAFSSLLLLVVITIPALYFNPGFGSLYVDFVVGGNFAALLVFVCQKLNRPKEILFCIPLIVSMVALKQIGLTLSNLTAMFLLYVIVKKKLFHVNYLILIGCLLVIPQVVDYGWKIGYMEKIGVSSINKSFLDKLSIAVTQLQTHYGLMVTLAFLKSLSLFFITKSGGVLTLLTVIAALFFVSRTCSKDKMRDVWMILQGSVIILLFYLLHRFVLYLSVYSVEHALTITSLKRYLNSPLLGILGLLLYLCKEAFLSLKNQDYQKYARAVKLWLVAAILIFIGRFYKKPYWYLPPKRQSMLQEISHIMPRLKAGQKIYILYNNFNVWDCLDYHFEISPYISRTNLQECFFVTKSEANKKFIADKQYLKEIDVRNFNYDLQADLSKYDVLFIPRWDNSLAIKLSEKIPTIFVGRHLFIRNKNNKFAPVGSK